MLANEPLIKSALKAVVALLVLLAAFGVHLTPEQRSAVVDTLQQLAPVVAAVWALYSARKHVTPLANPRTADGTPLVPATQPDMTPVDRAEPAPAEATPDSAPEASGGTLDTATPGV